MFFGEIIDIYFENHATGVLISPLPDLEGNKLGSMLGTLAISTTSRRELSSRFFSCKERRRRKFMPFWQKHYIVSFLVGLRTYQHPGRPSLAICRPTSCGFREGSHSRTLRSRYWGADKSLARPGRKQARKHFRNARGFNKIETRAIIKFFSPARQGAEGNSRYSDRNISLFHSWSG